MQESVHGERIPLIMPKHPEDETPFTVRLVISVRLSDTGTRQILLQVDSGSDGPLLYGGRKETDLPLLHRARPRGSTWNEAQRAFALLPSQNMRIGNRTFSNIPFVTPASSTLQVTNREEDGLLPTMLFDSVYISVASHYMVFNPR